MAETATSANNAAIIHPITGAKEAGSKLWGFFKGNPFGTFLAIMFLAALIVPPRKRKYKPPRKKSYTKRKKSNPGKVSKKRKTRKTNKRALSKRPEKTRTKTTRTRKRSGSKPARFIKGSPEARANMAKLRSMRRKK